MTFIRTTQGHHTLNVGDLTVTGVAADFNADETKTITEAAESAGVALDVADKADELSPRDPVAYAGGGQADLALGRGSVSGTAAPVYTRDDPRNPLNDGPGASDADAEPGLDYRALQERAKELDIPANQSAEALAAAIAEKE